MSSDDLDVGKCPFCGGQMITMWDDELDKIEYYECEDCGYTE